MVPQLCQNVIENFNKRGEFNVYDKLLRFCKWNLIVGVFSRSCRMLYNMQFTKCKQIWPKNILICHEYLNIWIYGHHIKYVVQWQKYSIMVSVYIWWECIFNLNLKTLVKFSLFYYFFDNCFEDLAYSEIEI